MPEMYSCTHLDLFSSLRALSEVEECMSFFKFSIILSCNDMKLYVLFYDMPSEMRLIRLLSKLLNLTNKGRNLENEIPKILTFSNSHIISLV